MDDEQGWIERARAGDGKAFEALVRMHQRAVYGLAMRMLRDHDDADDIAQRTFLRAWDGLAAFEGRSSLKTWLLRIAINLAKNHVRDRGRFLAVDVEPAEDAIGSERLEKEELLDRLHAAVSALPEKQRLTVELRVYQSLSFREIAEALETTENAAKVNFHYAVKTLKTRCGLDLAHGRAAS